MVDNLYSFGLFAYTTKFLLTGLNYLHNKCSVINTGGSIPISPVTLTVTLLDLKPENVLVGLGKTLSESLDDIVADEIKSLSPCRHRAKFFLVVPSTCPGMTLVIPNQPREIEDNRL
jgi:serine/threonine protein kinase